jgi:hypothetical protein
MSATNCNWFLPTTALISVFLLISTLSAQNHSDISRSDECSKARQEASRIKRRTS